MPHTLAPLEVCKHGTPDYAPQFGIYAPDSPNDIAIVKGPNAEADAHLFSAAPDLRASLETCVAHVLHYASMPNADPQAHRDAAIARAALAKATP